MLDPGVAPFQPGAEGRGPVGPAHRHWNLRDQHAVLSRKLQGHLCLLRNHRQRQGVATLAIRSREAMAQVAGPAFVARAGNRPRPPGLTGMVYPAQERLGVPQVAEPFHDLAVGVHHCLHLPPRERRPPRSRHAGTEERGRPPATSPRSRPAPPARASGGTRRARWRGRAAHRPIPTRRSGRSPRTRSMGPSADPRSERRGSTAPMAPSSSTHGRSRSSSLPANARRCRGPRAGRWPPGRPSPG